MSEIEKEKLNDDAVINIVTAVIKQAVIDYQKIYRQFLLNKKGKAETASELYDLKKFFRSYFFTMFTDHDPEAFINIIEKDTAERIDLRARSLYLRLESQYGSGRRIAAAKAALSETGKRKKSYVKKKSYSRIDEIS